MKKYVDSLNSAYRERTSLIILGLTGRTGSGCTTVSRILKTKKFSMLDLHDFKTHDFKSKNERKYEIVYKFMKEDNRWQPFTVIEGSSIIFSFILQYGFENFKKYFARYKETNDLSDVRISSYIELEKTLDGLSYMFKDLEFYNFSDIYKILSTDELVEKYYEFYTKTIVKYKNDFKRSIDSFTCHREITNKLAQTQIIKSHLYTYFMQEIGNNIRSSGNPYDSTYSEKNFYDVAQRMDFVIQVIQKYNQLHNIKDTRICIDAIRNPYEAYYFKDKYSSFYLLSINVEEQSRKSRLGNLDEEELKSLDAIEFEESNISDYSIFFHQNLQECLAISDIHLYNPNSSDGKMFFLTEQIIKYIALMLHPGIVSPSHVEHCMQSAYVAKLNSGCLSRQVGAVITAADYSIKAAGWNEVPEGQIPCNLRCVTDYCSNKDIDSYSTFELQDPKFQNILYKIKENYQEKDMLGYSYSFCFKDIYNGIKKDKNQVYTRALHAEENAFLQLSKNGGVGIKGGKLFTTASPCELCAKKAYQLGIKEIYYIDPYPGISVKHILTFGSNDGPKMILFDGAIGIAYVKLYTPRIPIKDELKLLTGINNKAIASGKNILSRELSVKDIKYKKHSSVFEFMSRTEITETTQKEIVALHDGIQELDDKVYWTGSSFDGIFIEECSLPHSFTYFSEHKEPYEAKTTLNEALTEGSSVTYKLRINAKDNQRIMNPYYAHLVQIKTDELDMTLKAPKSLLKNVKLKIYADLAMSNDLLVDVLDVCAEEQGDKEVFTFKTDNVNLMYSYSFEWDFNE